MAEQDIVERLRDAVDFTLTDCQRLLRKQDVDGICQHSDMCFEYSNVVRCGPCGIEQARRAGVETDRSLPNLPEVSRLNREIASLRQQLAEAREAIDAVWVCSFVIESSVRRGDGPAQYAQVVDALDLVKNFRALPHPDREGERE